MTTTTRSRAPTDAREGTRVSESVRQINSCEICDRARQEPVPSVDVVLEARQHPVEPPLRKDVEQADHHAVRPDQADGDSRGVLQQEGNAGGEASG